MPSSDVSSRLALNAPTGPITELTDQQVEQAIAASRVSPRKRIILPYHPSPDSTLHRMLNAVQPGSYIRPHRHLDPPKDEALVLLRGAVTVLVFDENGTILSTHDLRAGTDRFGIDLAAGVIHTFVATEPDTVCFEVKPGPYTRATDKDFMAWAPEEYTPEAERLVAEWEKA